jgi:hypothetical protein
MLLFIADYPDAASEKDGMMQRIMAIDRQFADVARSYLKVSLFRHLPGTRRCSGNLTVYRLNLFRHLSTIVRLVLKATCIYIHSVGNALAILPLYLTRKMVTDMHGAVPEEFQLAGRRLAAARYVPVEWVAVRLSRAVVTVSGAMAEHLQRKYRLPRLRFFNVPIFDEVTQKQAARPERARPVVIYAGGAQAWQNVDLMLEAMARVQERCGFVVLTGDVDLFRHKILGMGMTGVTIASVPKSEVYGHYANADYGFVLRDDTTVNRVACPTKLVEYLSCGVIPIVLQPRIGDFDDRGYAYLTLDSFMNGAFPSEDELEAMKARNYAVIEDMKRGALNEMQRLVEFCGGRTKTVAHGG